jgi:hypothetical protein
METQAAIQIIQALAQGVDPHTGETLPSTGPYQHPDTVRALFHAAQTLAGPVGTRARTAHQGAPANAGKPWTDGEDAALAERFDAGTSIPELAEQHARTRAAIQARLVRLGKIEPPADPPRFGRSATPIPTSAG